MRKSRVFVAALEGQDTLIEDVTIQTETSRGKTPVTSEVLVFSVRPKASQASRCSRCRKHCPGYDGGDDVRRWRTLDVGVSFHLCKSGVVHHRTAVGRTEGVFCDQDHADAG